MSLIWPVDFKTIREDLEDDLDDILTCDYCWLQGEFFIRIPDNRAIVCSYHLLNNPDTP